MGAVDGLTPLCALGGAVGCGCCDIPSTNHPCCVPGRGRVEHWEPEHPPGHGGARVWHHHRGGQHSLPLLWHVEDNFCLAHRGHGSLQHQLPAFWGAQILVSE